MTTFAPITEADLDRQPLPRTCLVCPRMPEHPPADGFYPDMPMERYLRIAAASRSLLAKPTPLHMQDYMAGEDRTETDETAFGTNLHACVLEPERFARDAITGPINERTGKPYGAETKAYEEFVREHPGKLILGRGDRDSIELAAQGLVEHDTFGPALTNGRTEVTMIWTCPATGIPFKSRIDLLTDDDAIDLKTARGISDRAIMSAILNYGYDIQAAVNMWGLDRLGAPRRAFRIMWVENTSPFAVRMMELGEESLKVGKHKLLTARDRLSHALRTDTWMGYPGGCPVLELPKFELDRYLNDGID